MSINQKVRVFWSSFAFAHLREGGQVTFVVCFPQCPLQKMPPIKDVVDVLPRVKAMSLADRAVFDRSMRAFVSYVQAYAKHECSLIFRVRGEASLRCLRLWREFSMNTAGFCFSQIWTLAPWPGALPSSACQRCPSSRGKPSPGSRRRRRTRKPSATRTRTERNRDRRC